MYWQAYVPDRESSNAMVMWLTERDFGTFQRITGQRTGQKWRKTAIFPNRHMQNEFVNFFLEKFFIKIWFEHGPYMVGPTEQGN